ncbi:malonate decarboxylase subunit delta [Saccharococcus caldoxylosilyticus]|uniref:Malonate decarboxylase acyl carrier protein n=1 Tax=Parageobacillus caldoxylosilyticus NBRC 107762 TaxID=1220594 RepID=A0A023DHH7_9BACL|nr:malonate decarboxylase subunit delta [Parageobacillus caldoxylosilyticus]MBB3853398.1 malonate decarboxylase delta subunit [Parageobacillus caldoxylosilyticus]QXJ40177.1 Malonate decarboxylase acyl carrier protein [Parageobacillus caldoxylosilyticus]BDG36206.1 malonate decarboxylase acyl carrier protein [Parageobacillus caldoxylosilyticus]BDG39991.1 malonate decarboxylase acyl carrier protein [Parageobacillus caldoxylosilyticus]BDG43711.1 malonate decarboxylase acyl carrier protein [Parageo
METLFFEYPATKTLPRRAHVGVVGSGDLEILMEPSAEARTKVTVRTSVKGFGKTWAKVLERFFTVHDVAATVKINDFGATPGVVTMRLAQALEVSQDNAILKR